MAFKLNVSHHAEAMNLRAEGLVGGRVISLNSPDGQVRLQVPLSAFPFLSPGDPVIITLGVTKIAVEDIPDELPGLSQLHRTN